MKSFVLTPDGARRDVAPAGDAWTLQELQSLVGGYIEVLPISGDRLMVVDEDGVMRGLAPNLEAEILADPRGHFGHVLGVAVVTPRALFR